MTEIMEKLQKPFDPSEIEWRVGVTTQDKSKGLALAYATNRAIQNRLDDVFGCFGWQNVFREWHGDSQLCGISVKFEGEWITKWDGADDSATEATKGGLSDSMKRAAYQWGIGRYLYKLPQFWVPIKPAGKSYVLVNKPDLPKWALPNGYKYEKRAEPHELSTENVPVEPPKTSGLTKAQLEEFGKLCEQEGGEAKTRLKKYVESMGYAKLSLVPQERFEELKDTFLSDGLPFSLEG